MPCASSESRGSCRQPALEEAVAQLQRLHSVINKPREVRFAKGTRHEYPATVLDTIRQLTEDELLAILQAVQNHQLILWIKCKGNFSFGYSIWRRPDKDPITDDDFLLWISPEHFPLALLPDLTSQSSRQDIDDAVFMLMDPYLRTPTNLALLERYGFDAPRERSSYEY